MDSSALLRMVQSKIPNLKKKSNQEYVGSCPSGTHTDKNPSWSINIESSVHHCFACGFKGNGVQLAEFWDEDPKPFYSDDYKHNQTLKNGHIKTNNVYPKQVNNQSNLQNNKVRNRPLLGLKKTIQGNNDIINILPEKIANRYTLEAWNELGVLYNTFYNKLVFPIKNKESEWVNCYYHKPNPYFHSKGFKTQVYPLELIKHFNPNDVLFVVEGLKDVLTMRSRGYQAISSTGGKKIPEDLSAIKHFKFICVIPDNDDNGKETSYKWCKELYALGIKVLICDWSKMKKEYPLKSDVSDISDKELTELIETNDIYKPPVEKYEQPKDKGDFHIVDLTRIKRKDYKPVQFAVETLMTTNKVNMLVGETGSGKSYFALQMAMSIASEHNDFLGFKINVKEPKVLYVDTEVGDDEVLERVDLISENFDDELFFKNMEVISHTERVEQAWEKIIRHIERYKPSIAIIDCLYNTAKGVNTSKANEVDKILDYVNQIRTYYPNLTILLVHHYNKGNSEQGVTLDRIAGASNIIWNISGVATGIIKSGISKRYRLIKNLKVRGKVSSSCYLLNHNPSVNYIEMMGIEQSPEIHLKTQGKTKKLVQLASDIREIVGEDTTFQVSKILNLQTQYQVNQSTMYTYISELEDMGLIKYVMNNGPSKIYELGNIKFRKEDLFLEE
jgi:RecA-family ATPase/5S rRNA maturation endonuclease (ribonuclease M5)